MTMVSSLKAISPTEEGSSKRESSGMTPTAATPQLYSTYTRPINEKPNYSADEWSECATEHTVYSRHYGPKRISYDDNHSILSSPTIVMNSPLYSGSPHVKWNRARAQFGSSAYTTINPSSVLLSKDSYKIMRESLPPPPKDTVVCPRQESWNRYGINISDMPDKEILRIMARELDSSDERDNKVSAYEAALMSLGTPLKALNSLQSCVFMYHVQRQVPLRFDENNSLARKARRPSFLDSEIAHKELSKIHFSRTTEALGLGVSKVSFPRETTVSDHTSSQSRKDLDARTKHEHRRSRSLKLSSSGLQGLFPDVESVPDKNNLNKATPSDLQHIKSNLSLAHATLSRSNTVSHSSIQMHKGGPIRNLSIERINAAHDVKSDQPASAGPSLETTDATTLTAPWSTTTAGPMVNNLAVCSHDKQSDTTWGQRGHSQQNSISANPMPDEKQQQPAVVSPSAEGYPHSTLGYAQGAGRGSVAISSQVMLSDICFISPKQGWMNIYLESKMVAGLFARKSWQKRYFVLSDRVLYVFKSDSSSGVSQSHYQLSPNTVVFVTDLFSSKKWVLEITENIPWYDSPNIATSPKTATGYPEDSAYPGPAGRSSTAKDHARHQSYLPELVQRSASSNNAESGSRTGSTRPMSISHRVGSQKDGNGPSGPIFSPLASPPVGVLEPERGELSTAARPSFSMGSPRLHPSNTAATKWHVQCSSKDDMMSWIRILKTEISKLRDIEYSRQREEEAARGLTSPQLTSHATPPEIPSKQPDVGTTNVIPIGRQNSNPRQNGAYITSKLKTQSSAASLQSSKGTGSIKSQTPMDAIDEGVGLEESMLIGDIQDIEDQLKKTMSMDVLNSFPAHQSGQYRPPNGIPFSRSRVAGGGHLHNTMGSPPIPAGPMPADSWYGRSHSNTHTSESNSTAFQRSDNRFTLDPSSITKHQKKIMRKGRSNTTDSHAGDSSSITTSETMLRGVDYTSAPLPSLPTK